MSEEQPESPILRRFYDLRQYLGYALIDLDKAFEQTPKILLDAGELKARADQIENAAKHTLDVIKAEVAERIRSGSAKEPSETKIAALLPMDPDVQDARAKLDNARYEAQVCEALYRSLDTQSRLIAKGSDMINSGYIAPSAGYEMRRAEIRQLRIADEIRRQSEGHVDKPTC